MFPAQIEQYLLQNHVLSFSVHSTQDFWTACCFYAVDLTQNRLIILTDKNTRHGKIMQTEQTCVGTISDQINEISRIEGIQFAADFRQLTNENEKQAALQIYYQKHPLARAKSSDVWELKLQYIKHTSNKIAFAQKTEWSAK